MLISLKIIVYTVTVFLVSLFYSEKSRITIYLIGDSTISIKEKKVYPETGWGMPFSHFFDSTVIVDNRAKNGRSTKSFLAEGLWQPVVAQLKEGDYVFIQFGHNDEAKDKVERYTTIEQFKANLIKYVNETKERKAIPVLVTPVSRRYFDSLGIIKFTHKMYSEAVEEIAVATNTKFIDLDKKSRELYQNMGPINSKLLFLHLDPMEHPNFPEGKKDDTHFNELGARIIAQIMYAEIRNSIPALAQRFVKPVVKK